MIDIRARHKYEIHEASLTDVDIEMGERNMETFYERFKDDSRYVFVKLFDKPIFSNAEYDACIVHHAGGNVKKLILFVYHP